MNPKNYDKIFNSFEFDPITEFYTKSSKPKVDNTSVNQSTYFTPIHFEQKSESSTEDILNKAKEKDIDSDTDTEQDVTTLPDKYSGLKEFYEAIDKDEVKTLKARQALLAQMGLESGWGKKSEGSKYFNYGNITTGSSWKGDYFRGSDTNAAGKAIQQKFRKYGNAQEFYDDYIKLIKNLYPTAYEQLTSDEFDIDKFSHGLRNGRVGMYAESPAYEDSLKTVFDSVRYSMNTAEQKVTPLIRNGGILYNY